LNAEGQQDVFNYYYQPVATHSPHVYPLPRQRPLNETATLMELQQITGKSPKIYAVYWATQQADPTGLIETWLDDHLFKATDQWYGNVRLVSYATGQPATIHSIDSDSGIQLGEHIQLTGYGLVSTQIPPGDILQLTLQWQTDAPLVDNYSFFGQILDTANHLVGQRDAIPLIPTSNWPVNKPITDTQGIFIEPGTPPGKYRLIFGLYEYQTGQRLPVESNQADFVELVEIEIIRPTIPLPREAFKIQIPLDKSMGDINLLGYDLYKLGHRSTPDAPLHPGDPVHVVLYWQVVRPTESDLTLQIIKANGEVTPIVITGSGIDYPIAGEIIRAQYDMFLAELEPGFYRVRLILHGHDTTTKLFRVE
jgi:hypothetical protein